MSTCIEGFAPQAQPAGEDRGHGDAMASRPGPGVRALKLAHGFRLWLARALS
ncbi:hypothetical protein [Microlunatus ginsengisoli]|jgi:hypothetical protein|uniref:hypothetical protein n=1 Tax=Microlunatus ginsengisoli TaxID=363863 RepID=UPI0031E451A1